MLQRLTTCKNSRADFGIIRIGSLSLSCQMSSSLTVVSLSLTLAIVKVHRSEKCFQLKLSKEQHLSYVWMIS